PASPFIMILHLHPPESPLFPYTTLFRSHRRRQPLQVGAVLVPVGGYSLAYQPPDADPRGCSARTSAADGRRPPHQAALCAPGGGEPADHRDSRQPGRCGTQVLLALSREYLPPCTQAGRHADSHRVQGRREPLRGQEEHSDRPSGEQEAAAHVAPQESREEASRQEALSVSSLFWGSSRFIKTGFA